MNLAYERTGAGPPLVLLHGIGHRRQAWRPVLDRLAAHREVICVDFPGFGESPPLPDHLPYEMDSLIAVMAEFYAALGLEQPHVAGNSMGGFVALVLAQRGMARSVTALAPAGLWTPGQRRRTLAVVGSMHRTARSLPTWLTPRLARTPAGRRMLAGIICARPELLDAEVLLQDLEALVGAVGFAPTLAAGRRIVFEGAVPDVPVTIAWGTRDRVVPRPSAELVTRLIPHARLLRLPDCGHVPMSDNPELVAHVLLTGSSDETPAATPPGAERIVPSSADPS